MSNNSKEPDDDHMRSRSCRAKSSFGSSFITKIGVDCDVDGWRSAE